jgi:hypothetical protein
VGTPAELLRNPGSDAVQRFVHAPLRQARRLEDLARAPASPAPDGGEA